MHSHPNMAYTNIPDMASLTHNQKWLSQKSQKWVFALECSLCQNWHIVQCNLCQKWHKTKRIQCNLCQKWPIVHMWLYRETECNLCHKWPIVHMWLMSVYVTMGLANPVQLGYITLSLSPWDNHTSLSLSVIPSDHP